MRPLKDRSARERGAVAVMVAIMATALFSVAALAVDLGNAWARKRAVQKQVDVSAIAAGWMLPMTSANKQAIAEKVAEYLNDPENQAAGQADVTWQDLIQDTDPSNGQIYWQNNAGSPCADGCTQMRVLAPVARVDFGLAGVMGYSGTDVQRAATVQVLSELPPKRKMLPFWLPNGCGYGPTQPDTEQGPPAPSPSATESPSATPTGPVAPTPVGSHTLTGAAVTAVGFGGSTTVTGYGVSDLGNQYKTVTLRAFPPTGSAFVDFGAQVAGNGSVPDFLVSTEVSNTPGDWYVFALAEKANGSVEYSANHLTIRVTGGPPPPTDSATPTPTATAVPNDCTGQDRGNFGQLDSPHTGYSLQQSFAPNIALGLDHRVVPYVFPSDFAETTNCGKHAPTIPGGVFDDTAGPAGDGANCISGNTGNDGPKIFDGLVGGLGGGIQGRLDATNPQGAPTSTQCLDDGFANRSYGSTVINDDRLSCYLRGGASLDNLAQSSGVTQAMLDPEVVKSPRFVWLPVVYATHRAEKDYQPIKQFVPGFITDETQAATKGHSDSTEWNGLTFNGSGTPNSIDVLRVFVFNRAALPPNEQADTTEYDPEVGGAIVRLIK